jgi:hypothetical protein
MFCIPVTYFEQTQNGIFRETRGIISKQHAQNLAQLKKAKSPAWV